MVHELGMVRMAHLGLDEMQAIQKQLQEKYKDLWGGLSPRKGRDQLLWMMIEAGEAADIIKKQGDTPILEDPETRQHFIEEMCDVLMYFNDVLLCYSVTPEELETVYRNKHKGIWNAGKARISIDFGTEQMRANAPNREGTQG